MQNQMDTTINDWVNLFSLLLISSSLLLLFLLGEYFTPFFEDLIVQLRLELESWMSYY